MECDFASDRFYSIDEGCRSIRRSKCKNRNEI